MKIIRIVALSLAASAASASALIAEEQQVLNKNVFQPSAGVAPSMALPSAGVATLMTLGNAGVFVPLFGDDLYGIVNERVGTARAAVGYGKSLPAGAAKPAYKDRDSILVAPVSILKELPSSSGASFIRFHANGLWSNANSGLPVENDGYAWRAGLQFLHAPVPAQLFGVGLVFERGVFDNIYNIDPFGTVGLTPRTGRGIQLLYAEDFSNSWAIAARAEYSVGETKFKMRLGLPGGMSIPYHHHQGDDRLNLQATLIGTYTHKELNWVPEGWFFRPILGAVWQRNFLESTADSMGIVSAGVIGGTEDYGFGFARARFEKQILPNPAVLQFQPNFTLGVEREFVNSFNESYVKEPAFAVVSAGVGITQFGQRLDFEFIRYQGFTGRRAHQAFVAALSFVF